MANDNLKIVLQLDAKGNMSKNVKNVNGQLNKFKSASRQATAGSARLEKSLNKLSMYGHGPSLAF